MPQYGSDRAFILVGGRNLGNWFTNLSDQLEAMTEESHGLGDSWREVTYTGLRQMQLTGQGFYDDTNTATLQGPHLQFENGPGSTHIVCYGVEGDSASAAFVGIAGVQINYNRQVVRGELHKFDVEIRANGRVDEGRIVRALAPASTSGQTTNAAVDFGTCSTAGAAGYLQLKEFASGAGSTGLLIDIMHSADNLTFTSYAAFTLATAAPLAQRIQSTAPLQRYVAEMHAGNATVGFPSSAVWMVGVAHLGR